EVVKEVVMHVFVFFFFQAEDGIRDYKVTGVQTWLFRSGTSASFSLCPESQSSGRQQGKTGRCAARRQGQRQLRVGAQGGRPIRRSEERRVGKECTGSQAVALGINSRAAHTDWPQDKVKL